MMKRLDNMKRTRWKLALITFAILIVSAYMKHWLPGISEELLITAAAPAVAYLWAETKRPSGNGEYS